MPATDQTSDSPATLVAIARAAHVAGDRELEAVAKRQLSEHFGIKISFTKERPTAERK